MSVRGWPHHIVKILELLGQFKPERCVEIGTFAGASAIPIARAIAEWRGHLTCIDVWKDRRILSEFADNLLAAGVTNVSLVPMPSVEVARGWSEPIDFLYIDGDHSYEGVKSDLDSWFRHLRTGALLCGDDYDDPLSPGVAKAWDEFEKIGQAFERFATPNTVPAGMKLVWGAKR